MNRLEETRKMVDELLPGIADPIQRRCAYVHLYGVSKFAALLALKRGLDPELTAVSGMLHDIYAFRTGIGQFHDQNGAEDLRPTIRNMGIFTDGEQFTILSAIFHHSDKLNVHQPYDELLKDADVLQHYFYNTDFPVLNNDAARLETILEELRLPTGFKIIENNHSVAIKQAHEDKRAKLADIAEALAVKNIIGLPEDKNFQTICRYWPDKDIYQTLHGNWCAAFVYHCCSEAGFVLPIRHPLVSCRFAGVGAWLEWAQLPETGFFYNIDDKNFLPARGDIVIYEKLLTNRSLDHIGIVLFCQDKKIIAAEGNVDNQNQAGIVNRDYPEKISGFIRIDNRFKYDPTGRAYDPQILRK